MTEHTAHVLGGEGVTPVRFDIVENVDGTRRMTNIDPITMRVGDVVDMQDVTGGRLTLMRSGDVIEFVTHLRPKDDEA